MQPRKTGGSDPLARSPFVVIYIHLLSSASSKILWRGYEYYDVGNEYYKESCVMKYRGDNLSADSPL